MNIKNTEYWRKKGEEDRIQNKGYRKPHGIFAGLFIWTVSGLRKIRLDNEAYYIGWTYTADQNTRK